MLLPGHVEVRQSHTISSHFTANISTRCTAMFVVSCESTVQSTSFARIGIGRGMKIVTNYDFRQCALL